MLSYKGMGKFLLSWFPNLFSNLSDYPHVFLVVKGTCNKLVLEAKNGPNIGLSPLTCDRPAFIKRISTCAFQFSIFNFSFDALPTVAILFRDKVEQPAVIFSSVNFLMYKYTKICKLPPVRFYRSKFADDIRVIKFLNF